MAGPLYHHYSTMRPRLETRDTRNLVGICRKHAAGRDSTAELWKQFMPRRREIESRVNTDLISMRVFHRTEDEPLTRQTPYDEWAAVEVSDSSVIPNGMESYRVPDGLYAVFIHEGPASRSSRTMQYIFGEWLPDSEYELDNRPHLAVMGADYKPDDPKAKEEIWIPVSRPAQI